MYTYTELIEVVTPPLEFFFAVIAPLVGVYISYLVARSVHNKFFEKNSFVRILLPAFLLGTLSTIVIALSGIFAAHVSAEECSISIGDRGACGLSVLIALAYIIFSFPAGGLLFSYALFIFRKSSSQINGKTRHIGIYQKVLIFLLPIIFIGTFLLYLPTNKIAVDLVVKNENDTKADRIAEQISKASENEYVCSVHLNEITISLTVLNDEVFYKRDHQERRIVGKIEGTTVIFTEYPYGYTSCYNSNGENFMKKFFTQLAQ